MDELHLFQNGRLPGLSSSYSIISYAQLQLIAMELLTEKKHLDLISLHHLVPLQLILNLLVPHLPLLLLCAHTATHLDG